MRMNQFLWGLASLCLAGGAQALTKEDFDRIEYAVNTGTGDTLPYASDSLTEAFGAAFPFVRLEDDPSEKLVVYLDTPDRVLKQRHLSIRVREHVTKPGKSKITVKLRAADPAGFGDLTGYDKAEIDYDGEQSKYSVSYDIPFSPEEIDVRRVAMDRVIALIRRDGNAWNLVGDLLEGHREALRQTVVMRTYGWEGTMTNRRFDGIEVDFQMWTPYYRKPRVSFAEFSFKGRTADRRQLDQAFHYLREQVQRAGLPAQANHGSKTRATFAMSHSFH